MRAIVPLSSMFVVLGCGAPAAPPSGEAAPAAVIAAAKPTSDGPKDGPAIAVTWIDDDFARAQALARDEGKLVFVDVWAPWCHTCLAMKDGVLDAPALGVHSTRFVFAALDGDREENAEFVGRYPMRVWPTFFVLDPNDDRPLAVHGGAMSADELDALLRQVHAARMGAGAAAADAALAEALAAGHAAFARREFAGAADHYERAAARPWPRRNEALLAAMYSHAAAKDPARCTRFGMAQLGVIEGSSAQTDFVGSLRSCAAKLDDASERARVMSQTLERLRALAAAFPAGASVDDRADLLAMLADAEREAGNTAAATAVHETRLRLLEDAAAQADGPAGARVYDYARMVSYQALGRGAEAEALFVARVGEFPESYEAWARLASTRQALGKPSEALVAIDRAIALSYGPRRLRYLATKAELQAATGDHVGAIATLEAELAAHSALPEGQRDRDKLEQTRARLDAARKAGANAPDPAATPTTPGPTTPPR